MAELQWDPGAFGRLTIAQLMCLLSDKPPGERGPIVAAEDWEETIEARKREEREWAS